MRSVNLSILAACFLFFAMWGTLVDGAPTAEQALKLRPIQKGVDYDKPEGEKADKCTVIARKIGGRIGWIVADPDGTILRKFLDTNGDNFVDLWSYYRDGIEIYRDIDADFDHKADQYRWFHTAGSRWGLDRDQDGLIDAWKVISAEEVTAEVVAALATRDARRFARLMISPNEVRAIGLGKEKALSVNKRVGAAAAGFRTMAARQKTVGPNTNWIQFSGNRPGTVPAGTDGSTKDLQVYENVVAVVETNDKHDEVQIGTLVRVGDTWRLIDLPQVLAGDQANAETAGFFFQTSLTRQGVGDPAGTADGGQKMLDELEKLDKAAENATTPAEQAKYNTQRADLLEKMADAGKTSDDRAMWLRQLADMISAAVSSGTYPDGAKRLADLFERLQKNEADKELAAYVRFRQLTADYVLSMQVPKSDFAEVQAEWLKSLEQYVADYPTAPDAAEAMLQLAIAEEYAAQEDEAKKWYGKIVETFPNTPAAKKADGARTRLDSVGKTIPLTGKSVTGSPIDLAQYRGQVVLIQYWATWSKRALTDMAVLKELAKKHSGKFTVIGVSLDSDRKALSAYLTENRLPWPQIFEEGGLDSAPANQLGILTLPTMILVDRQGKVVDRNIQSTELDAAVKKLIHRRSEK